MAYIGQMLTRPITIAETAVFMRQAADIWNGDERSDLIDFIARSPEAGDLIPDNGGVREIRWRRQGMGRRGGVRVISFYGGVDVPLYLLLIYAKARRDDLSPDAKRAVQALAAKLKNARRRVRDR